VSTRTPPVSRRDGVVVGFLALVLVASSLVALAVPGVDNTPTAGATPSTTPAASRPPATVAPARAIRDGMVGLPGLINPLLGTTRTDQSLAALIFDGLVRLGPGQTLEPALADRWSRSDDGRTWTFHLSDGASWHDGQPVTAADVVFTIDLLQDPDWNGPAASSWRDVSATAVDQRSVRFELGTPLGSFLQAATQPILPAHLLARVPVAQLANDPFNRAPVGAGPYRLVSLDDRSAVLAPVAAGPGASPIEVAFYPDATSLAAAFERGDVDLASGLPVDEAVRLGALPGATLVRYPTTTLSAVILNLRPRQPELRDVRVRTALLGAINRPSVVQDAWKGSAAVARSLIPEDSWAFDPATSPEVPFDRAAARKALREAGWGVTDGGRLSAPKHAEPFAFDLLSPDVATNPAAVVAAASIAADWRALGLDVTPEPLPPDELVGARLRPGRFAAALVDINVGLDPDLYPLLASTQGTSQGLNLSGLVDRDLDKLLEAARAPGSEAARKDAYRALQARLAERQYVLPICFHQELVVASESVLGIDPRELGSIGDRYWDVLSWRLADGG
jgi:peptide/nickel transport system substrate-binding protein